MNAQSEPRTPLPFVERRRVPFYPQAAPDEVSLVDLWLVLVRRKWVVAAAAAIGIIGGLAFVLISPPNYAYTTTIEIGTQIVNNQVTPIEAQDSVRAKIAESYIPLVVQKYLEGRPDADKRYRIEASAPKNSQVVVLTSQGPEGDEAIHRTLHLSVVQMIQDDHKRVTNVLKRGIETRIAEQERKIAELKESASVLQAKIKRLEDERTLLATEIRQTEALIAKADQEREAAVGEAAGASQAMTMLLITEELRHNRTRLTDLKQRVAVEIPERQDDLEKELSDNQRAREDEKAQIESLRLALVSMLETRAVAPPIRLPDPVGPGRNAIVALSLLLGLMLGVFAAFFAEFLSKAKAEMGNG